MTKSDRYPANVFWSDEDEGFIAEAPDLPGCSAFGETQAEALTELQDAIAAWIEAAKAAGNRIPEPSQPAVERHSGKVLLRMPRPLHAELAAAAKRDDVSLNQYIVYLITKWHSQRDAVAIVRGTSALSATIMRIMMRTTMLTTSSERYSPHKLFIENTASSPERNFSHIVISSGSIVAAGSPSLDS